MAKVTGALLSLGASGSIAKTLVASKWKGRPYFRQHVIPANPQSTAQTLTRDIFRNLSSIWLALGTNQQAPWDRFADGQVLTGRNAYIGKNIQALRGEADLAKWLGSPGAKGGLIADAVVLTPGSGNITVAITAPTPPTGWSIINAQAIMIEDGAPEDITNFTTIFGADAVSPYSIVLTGLASTTYSVAAWIAWTKADGTLAYGPSITALATTLA